ncbi:hypothetical protein ACIHDR_20860 [Nocardia sp. NPDC052278]|uniref:hypothetical protein n=1 Tax=unclassified Nocardia TaxID=2637762 RepID=UPI0036800E9B
MDAEDDLGMLAGTPLSCRFAQGSLDDLASVGTVPLNAQGAASTPKRMIAEVLLKGHLNSGWRTEK